MKKSIKVLIIVIALLVVCVAVYAYIDDHKKKTDALYEIGKFTGKLYDEQKETMIKPRGIFILNRSYKGKNDLDDFYRATKSLANYTINVSKMNDNSFNDEYKNPNFKTDDVYYNVNNIESLLNYYKSKKLKNVDGAVIDTNTVRTTNRGIKFNMAINYDENKEKANYEVELLDAYNKKVFVNFSIIN